VRWALSAHAAAEHGLGQLASLLAGAGFPSYEEFIWTALPAEVMARANAGVGYPDRTDSASEWWPLLAAGARVHRALTSWVGQLDTLQELADALVAGGQRVRAGITASEQAAGDLTAAASATSGFSPVMASLTLWVAMTAEMDEMLRALADRLAELRTGVARTRFGIALGSLESETVGRFVSELMDGGPGARDAQPAIRDLVVALRKGVTQASAETAANAALAASVADEVQALAELLGVPTTLLAGFEAMAGGAQRSRAVGRPAPGARGHRPRPGRCRRVVRARGALPGVRRLRCGACPRGPGSDRRAHRRHLGLIRRSD
jgi:aerotaxis receptor